MGFGDAFADAFSSSYRTSSQQMFELLQEKREQDRKARAVSAVGELKDIANTADEINQAGGEAVVDQMPGAAISGKKLGITDQAIISGGGVTPTQLIEERARQLAEADPSIAPEMFQLLTDPRSWIQTHKQETLDYQSANSYVKNLAERYGDDPLITSELALINAIKNPTLKLQAALNLGGELNDPQMEEWKYTSEYMKHVRQMQMDHEVALENAKTPTWLYRQKALIGHEYAVKAGGEMYKNYRAMFNYNYTQRLNLLEAGMKTLDADNAQLVATAESGGWQDPDAVVQTFEFNDTTYSLTWKEAAGIYALTKDGKDHWSGDDLKLLGLQPEATFEAYMLTKYGLSGRDAESFADKITKKDIFKDKDFKALVKYSNAKEAMEMERAMQVQTNIELNKKMTETEAQYFSKDTEARIRENQKIPQQLDIITNEITAEFAKEEGLSSIDLEELNEIKAKVFETIANDPKEADNYLRNEEATTIQAYAKLVNELEAELGAYGSTYTDEPVPAVTDRSAFTAEAKITLQKKLNVARKLLRVAIETTTADISQPWLGSMYDAATIESLDDAGVNLAEFDNAAVANIYTTLESVRSLKGNEATLDDYIAALHSPDLAGIFEAAGVDTAAFYQVLGTWYDNLSDDERTAKWNYFNTVWENSDQRSYEERLRDR